MDAPSPMGHTRSGMKEEGLGLKFWAAMVGIILAAGLGGMILFLIFSRAVYAWGFLGAFLAFALVLIVFGWFYDRRKARQYADFDPETE